MVNLLILFSSAQEDAHATELDLDGSGENSNGFFAIYDGHAGAFLSSTIFDSLSNFHD